ncbi:12219_t:CDS:2, partial [Entrophospora sp. SA101]
MQGLISKTSLNLDKTFKLPGESTHNIASALNHSQSQVTRAIQAFKGEDQTIIAPRSGRPSALNDHDVRQ